VTHQTCIFQITVFGPRETGGSNATIDILTGNNPHLGYSGGFKYINQFKSILIFSCNYNSASKTLTINSSNLYINNESGTFNKSVENSILDSVILQVLMVVI
jgi:hypothetical protein